MYMESVPKCMATSLLMSLLGLLQQCCSTTRPLILKIRESRTGIMCHPKHGILLHINYVLSAAIIIEYLGLWLCSCTRPVHEDMFHNLTFGFVLMLDYKSHFRLGIR